MCLVLCMRSGQRVVRRGKAAGAHPSRSGRRARRSHPNLPDGRAGSRMEARQPGVASAVHDATEIGLPVTG